MQVQIQTYRDEVNMRPIPQSPVNGSQLMRDNRYEITHYRDTYLKKVSLHSHDFYELYFFISGHANYIIDNIRYELKSGDILLISPDNLHRLDLVSPSEAYERIVLWINPKYVKALSTPNTDLSEAFRLHGERKNFLVRDFLLSERIKSILLELEECKDGFGDDVKSEILIKAILLELCKNAKATAVSTEKISKKTSSPVSKIIDYIDGNLHTALTLDKLEEVAFVSKYYLARIFKEETNSTIHQYILKKRLLLSKRYIEQGLPINEIYLKCGFQDYSNFFRAFKKEYSITPKQYLSLIAE